jgi:hypothetical protein
MAFVTETCAQCTGVGNNGRGVCTARQASERRLTDHCSHLSFTPKTYMFWTLVRPYRFLTTERTRSSFHMDRTVCSCSRQHHWIEKAACWRVHGDSLDQLRWPFLTLSSAAPDRKRTWWLHIRRFPFVYRSCCRVVLISSVC